MQRPRVLFPHPDSPTRPNVFPRSRVNETPSTARTVSGRRRSAASRRVWGRGKCLTRSRTSSKGSANGGVLEPIRLETAAPVAFAHGEIGNLADPALVRGPPAPRGEGESRSQPDQVGRRTGNGHQRPD